MYNFNNSFAQFSATYINYQTGMSLYQNNAQFWYPPATNLMGGREPFYDDANYEQQDWNELRGEFGQEEVSIDDKFFPESDEEDQYYEKQHPDRKKSTDIGESDGSHHQVNNCNISNNSQLIQNRQLGKVRGKTRDPIEENYQICQNARFPPVRPEASLEVNRDPYCPVERERLRRQLAQNSDRPRFLTRSTVIKEFQRQARKIYVQKQIRSDQKKWMAKSFISRGYGAHLLREMFKQANCPMTLDNNRYKTVSCAFATEVYRELQNFLIKQCGKQINTRPMNEMKMLYTIILNCKKLLHQRDIETLLKFARKTYGLAEQRIMEDEAIELYIQIEMQLARKKGQPNHPDHIQVIKMLRTKGVKATKFILPKARKKYKKREPKYSEDDSQEDPVRNEFKITKQYLPESVVKSETGSRNWHPQFQKILIDLYMQCGRLSPIRDHIHKLYPFTTEFLTSITLKRVLFKLVRSTVRTLQLAYKHDPLAMSRLPMPSLTDICIKKIMETSQGLPIRCSLLSYVAAGSNDARTMREIGKQIIEFLKCFQSKDR